VFKPPGEEVNGFGWVQIDTYKMKILILSRELRDIAAKNEPGQTPKPF
jgi:hypothetical protein